MPVPVPPMKWDGWGDPALAEPLSDDITALLKNALGVSAEDIDVPTIDEVRLRPSALTESDEGALAAVVGADQVSTRDGDRLRRAGGKSTLDLLRRKSREPQDAPDGVVVPGSDDEIGEILNVCSRRRIAVVPFGGGTSVVGGLDPVRGEFGAVVSLDLRRFDAVGLDEISAEATLGAGLPGPRAEELLAERGYELGHYPQSFRFATIGGFAATRSSGQNSAGYGRFDEMVRGLRVVTPAGVLDLGRAPASAAGPDLRELFLGSEGAFGVITALRLQVHPVPEVRVYEAWTFPDFATGAHALRAVEQQGDGPTVLRLSDEVETGIASALEGQSGSGGCLAITVFEGTAAHVGRRQEAIRGVMQAARGTLLGENAARAWEHGRFATPYLRDALLANGALCETLETATSWSNLATLKTAVTEALQSSLRTSLVMCHISHVYPTGASLYFTVVAALGHDPIARWQAAKRAAGDAIMAHGGTITHHHAVGVDHRPWMTQEIGALGVQILRAVKATVDPAGILNPGKLIP
jgi:alkyldihydroxyacetonephosphate synthase